MNPSIALIDSGVSNTEIVQRGADDGYEQRTPEINFEFNIIPAKTQTALEEFAPAGVETFIDTVVCEYFGDRVPISAVSRAETLNARLHSVVGP